MIDTAIRPTEYTHRTLQYTSNLFYLSLKRSLNTTRYPYMSTGIVLILQKQQILARALWWFE